MHRERGEVYYCDFSNVTAGQDMEATFTLFLSILCVDHEQVTSVWLKLLWPYIAALSCSQPLF